MKQYLGDRKSRFDESLGIIWKAVQQGDEEASLKGVHGLAETVGVVLRFPTFGSFDEFMLKDDGPLRI